MSYKSKLQDIKAFVFDVDGVFTDGSVYLLPDGNMSRVMNVLDGYAVVKALKNDYKICVITGGNDAMVKNRLNYILTGNGTQRRFLAGLPYTNIAANPC